MYVFLVHVHFTFLPAHPHKFHDKLSFNCDFWWLTLMYSPTSNTCSPQLPPHKKKGIVLEEGAESFALMLQSLCAHVLVPAEVGW